jgi:hypothetical protein
MQAYAGSVAWYAAAAIELLSNQASGRPLQLDAVYRWRCLTRGGHDTCPDLPDDEQVVLGIEARDREVAASLALVRPSRDAEARLEDLERKLDELKEKEGADSRRVRCLFNRVRDAEDEVGVLAEAPIRIRARGRGGTDRVTPGGQAGGGLTPNGGSRLTSPSLKSCAAWIRPS